MLHERDCNLKAQDAGVRCLKPPQPHIAEQRTHPVAEWHVNAQLWGQAPEQKCTGIQPVHNQAGGIKSRFSSRAGAAHPHVRVMDRKKNRRDAG
ncbi:hypothetical protein NDU88_006624 [Pleurodeles waltl]|uniref:Uncharacterized protein n=1 Tax=Pleurodeles waltl TaxID=8319 RepID=A0AAV7VQ67_PLEWA|nr:hypothetical protein NDU88_006624 [Pleurodeles waltl]